MTIIALITATVELIYSPQDIAGADFYRKNEFILSVRHELEKR